MILLMYYNSRHTSSSKNQASYRDLGLRERLHHSSKDPLVNSLFLRNLKSLRGKNLIRAYKDILDRPGPVQNVSMDV